MAKEEAKKEEKQEEQTQAPQEAPAPAPAQQQQAPRVVDDGVITQYSNFCSIMGTPEEVLLSFGNRDWQASPDEPARIDTKIVVNYYNAKRILVALHQTVKRHEDNFGPIELDLRARMAKISQ